MGKTFEEFRLGGYADGQTKFVERLGEDQKTFEDFVDKIVRPIGDVLLSADQTAVLCITGHADRADAEGLTREQRRAAELSASFERAVSAAEGTANLISNIPGAPKPEDVTRNDKLEFLTEAAGAAALIHSDVALSPEQRKANRRVVFRLFRFQPE